MHNEAKQPVSAQINDVTGLNPVPVWSILTPTSVEEIQEALRQTSLPVSVGGGHFSMGGQTACPGSLHIDMRAMNKVLHFAPFARSLRVQAGIRWCDVQRFIDPHGLAVSIMPRHANFTVGGSLSTNAAGLGIGQGPIIESVLAIALVLPNGERAEASASKNSRLFYAAIGGYAAVGIIVEVELQLANNMRLQCVQREMPLERYESWYEQTLKTAAAARFHEVKIIGRALGRIRASVWVETSRHVTVPAALQPAGGEGFSRHGIVWRNYLAGGDLGRWYQREHKAWVRVQQGFCLPLDRLTGFVDKLNELITRHRIELLDLTFSRLGADPGSLLSWTRDECCLLEMAFQHPRAMAGREAVAVWMRELISVVLSLGGSFQLSGQPHATPEQFHQAFPHARELFAIKREFDPACRLRNSVLDKYYLPWLQEAEAPAEARAIVGTSVFQAVYGTVAARDAFYGYLLREGGVWPADQLHAQLRQACREHSEDAAIYQQVQQALALVRPRMAGWRYAWPRQRIVAQALAEQVRELIGQRDHLTGFLEVEGEGHLLARLAGPLRLRGEVLALGTRHFDNSLSQIFARGARVPSCRFLELDGYAPIADETVKDNSLDLVTCCAGLHGVPLDRLGSFLGSLYRVLRPGGMLVLRDHDVRDENDLRLARLAHMLRGLITSASWQAVVERAPSFVTAEDWAARLAAAGFTESGVRIGDLADPLRRVTLVFAKRGLSGARA